MGDDCLDVDAPAVATGGQDSGAAAQKAEMPEIKLFGRWVTDDVQVSDISLADYIRVKEKYARYLPHSAGRFAAKRFRKAQCPIVERLTNALMMHGRNNGKKLLTVRIVKHAFEISLAHRRESTASSSKCNHQLWSQRRLHTYWSGWYCEEAGCRCVPTQEG